MTSAIHANWRSRRCLMWLGLVIALLLLAYQIYGLTVAPELLIDHYDDYIAYWAAGRLNLHRQAIHTQQTNFSL